MNNSMKYDPRELNHTTLAPFRKKGTKLRFVHMGTQTYELAYANTVIESGYNLVLMKLIEKL